MNAPDPAKSIGITTPLERLRAGGRRAVIDRMTAEVVSALRDAGVRSVLLKGPAVAQWLYEDPNLRDYTDVDLLIAKSDVPQAESILVGLSYTRLAFEAPSQHAQAWLREGLTVDLHRRLVGVAADDDVVWDLLSAGTESLAVAGERVEILPPAGRAMHIVLHAAQHGAMEQQPLTDLARALERLTDDVWGEAASLAAQLDALPAFATGLRLDPRGKSVAARLGLSELTSVEATLRAGTATDLSLALERLANMQGLGPRAAFVRRKLFPSAEFMRAWSPLARRGRAGLTFSYVGRFGWLARRAGPGLRAWLTARRENR